MPKKQQMKKLKLLTNIQEAYDELRYKTSWPTRAHLVKSAIVVMIASVIIALNIHHGSDSRSLYALYLQLVNLSPNLFTVADTKKEKSTVRPAAEKKKVAAAGIRAVAEQPRRGWYVLRAIRQRGDGQRDHRRRHEAHRPW